MTDVTIRRLRFADLRQVVAIEREAFPADPWTTATARGWLARSALTRRSRWAGRLAVLFRLAWVNEALSLSRLIRLVVLGRPASLRYFVAAAGPDVCGYACLNAVAGLGDVQMIAVRASRRGEGIGTALLARLLDDAAARGCREAFLYVRADNPGARQLYERTGFTQTGVRPRFYQPSGTDAVVMRVSCAASLPLSRRDP
jgi:ribosomal-protein-alanine acetyltransferase